ncbi:hypothetical protein F2P56_004128, partial [Juglans regia]
MFKDQRSKIWLVECDSVGLNLSCIYLSDPSFFLSSFWGLRISLVVSTNTIIIFFSSPTKKGDDGLWKFQGKERVGTLAVNVNLIICLIEKSVLYSNNIFYNFYLKSFYLISVVTC